jgi:hypothetical protein
MTTEERADILVTARLMRAAGTLDWLSTGFTLLAASALIFGNHGRAQAIAVLLLGLIAKVGSVRVDFDARVLEDVASSSLETSDLDSALTAISARQPSGRPWTVRCRGARRLVNICAGLTAAQALALALMAMR